MTNSERRISRQRAFLPPPGEAKPDWWIVDAGRAPHGLRRGVSPIASAADIFREHAALSAFENDGRRDFDLGGLARHRRRRTTTRSIRCNGRCRAGEPRHAAAGPRFFAEGGFYHAGPQGALHRARRRRRRARRAGNDFPFRLNTGRVRDQWHTMTRIGPEPAARRACARAVRRGASRRRRGERTSSTATSRRSRPAGARACSR